MPGAAGARHADVRPAREDLRRLGDPPPPHPGLRLGRGRARGARGAARDRRGHLVLPRQLPARGLGRGDLGRRLAGPGGAGPGRLDHRGAELRRPRQHRQHLPGLQQPGLHPRPAEHLSRRRGGPAAGARLGRSGSAGAGRPDRPGRHSSRRRHRRMLRHVLFRCPARALSGNRPDRWPTAGRPPAAAPPATTTWWSPWPVRPGCRSSPSTPGISSAMRPAGCGSRPGRPTTSRGTRSSPSGRCRRIRGTGSGCRTTRRSPRSGSTSIPDGGFSRLHLLGQLSPQALSAAISQWLLRLPAQASTRVLLDAGPRRYSGAGADRQAIAEPGLVAADPVAAAEPGDPTLRRSSRQRGRSRRLAADISDNAGRYIPLRHDAATWAWLSFRAVEMFSERNRGSRTATSRGYRFDRPRVRERTDGTRSPAPFLPDAGDSARIVPAAFVSAHRSLAELHPNRPQFSGPSSLQESAMTDTTTSSDPGGAPPTGPSTGVMESHEHLAGAGLIKPGYAPRLTNEDLAPLKKQTWTLLQLLRVLDVRCAQRRRVCHRGQPVRAGSGGLAGADRAAGRHHHRVFPVQPGGPAQSRPPARRIRSRRGSRSACSARTSRPSSAG